MDYLGLISVIKLDKFLLPRIDNIKDQLERSCYFTTLDLVFRYLQIWMDKDSMKKMVLMYQEFQVVPFGLTNPPAVF